MDRYTRARTVVVALFAIGVLGVPALSAFAGSTIAAGAPATGFIVDSETGNALGGGQLHDHFPATVTATGTASDVTIVGSGWTFRFAKTGGLTVGTTVDGGSTFVVQRNGSSCNSSDWSYEISQLPVVTDGVVTAFAVDFWRNRCGLLTSAALFGSIRIGSTIPVAMVHTTSSLELPDTFEDAIAPDATILVRNVGETFITVDAAVLGGLHAGDYAIVDGCAPVVLDPGQECTIAVTFDPTNTTERTASITVPTSAYGPDRQVDVTGYALSPILRTNSALVIDGLPSAFTDGEHWYDPTSMTASGDSDSLQFATQDWVARFQSPDNGVPLAPGAYPDVAPTRTNGQPGLSVARGGWSCSEPLDGSFTVLEGPVIDSDGTILRFAADFTYSCPETSGFEVRGWLRFHSDLPRPVPETVDYGIDVDTGSLAQVGETITLSPVVAGLDFYDAVRCTMVIESIDPLPWVRMQVASDSCEAWTLVVPPAAAGHYRISGNVYFTNASSPSYRAGPELGLEIAPGTAVPFVTNYPVQSWAPSDLISDPTPAFGAPVTIRPATGADGCRLRLDAGMEQIVTYQRTGCQPWTVTLPAPTPEVAESFFLDRTAVQSITWEGASDWANQNPEAPFVGTRYGETYHASLPLLDGVGGQYASDLPAIFSGDARGNVYYSDDPSSHAFAPVVIGATSGSCVSNLAPFTRPVTGGACATFVVPPSEVPGNSGARYGVELRDEEGLVIAESSTDIGFVGRLSALDLDVPATITAGTTIPIDVSTSAGAPAAYEVVLSPVASGAAGLAAAETTYQGSLAPSIGGGDGAAIEIEAASLTVGSWDIRATFTDVLGETATETMRISVTPADAVLPTATAPRRGFAVGTALSSGAIPTRIPWSGADVGSGIARYELHQQTNGGAWTTVSTMLTSPSVTRGLATEKTYRFRVRAVDKAGNVGAWAYGDTFRVTRSSETNARITYSGTWVISKATAFWGGQAKASSRAGARASLTFTGRSAAWVASMGPTRGKADVYVNGSKVATVDLYSATSKHQQVVWAGSWTTAASRTITIRVQGTSGRPRVDVDALVTAN